MSAFPFAAEANYSAQESEIRAWLKENTKFVTFDRYLK